ncbi:MAG: CPBP family intramembrane glutamic endopeptidase [Chitinophagaceae bacterium]
MFSIRNYLVFSSYGVQLLVLSGLFLMGLTLGGMLSIPLQDYFVGVSNENLLTQINVSEAQAQGLKIVNTITNCFVFLVPALLFAYLAFEKPKAYLHLDMPINGLHIMLAIAILFSIMPFIAYTEFWSAKIPMNTDLSTLEKQYEKISTAMLSGTSTWSLITSIIAIAIIPPLSEELFFRGVLQNVLTQQGSKNPFWGIIITAIVFSMLHGQVSGLLPRIFLGIMLGLVYYLSANLWLSIGLHFLNNFLAVVLVFLKNKHSIQWDAMESNQVPMYMAIYSLVLVSALFFYFYKHRATFTLIMSSKEKGEYHE